MDFSGRHPLYGRRPSGDALLKGMSSSPRLRKVIQQSAMGKIVDEVGSPDFERKSSIPEIKTNVPQPVLAGPNSPAAPPAKSVWGKPITPAVPQVKSVRGKPATPPTKGMDKSIYSKAKQDKDAQEAKEAAEKRDSVVDANVISEGVRKLDLQHPTTSKSTPSTPSSKPKPKQKEAARDDGISTNAEKSWAEIFSFERMEEELDVIRDLENQKAKWEKQQANAEATAARVQQQAAELGHLPVPTRRRKNKGGAFGNIMKATPNNPSPLSNVQGAGVPKEFPKKVEYSAWVEFERTGTLPRYYETLDEGKEVVSLDAFADPAKQAERIAKYQREKEMEEREPQTPLTPTKPYSENMGSWRSGSPPCDDEP